MFEELKQITVNLYSLGFLSVVANIIFPLILVFQWYRNHSREQATKYTIFATKRMVSISKDSGAPYILSALDAVLATLGYRGPFKRAADFIIKNVLARFKKEEEMPLEEDLKDFKPQAALTKSKPKNETDARLL